MEAQEFFIGDVDPRFTIEDDRQAEWAVGKIREKRAEAAKFKAFYEEMARKIDMQCQGETDYLEGLLYDYFERVPSKETKTQKSYKLPTATLILRKESPKYERDEEALVRFLEENERSDMVKVKKSPNWAEYKKETKLLDDGTLVDIATGEVVSGVTVTMEPHAFTVNIEG